MKKLIAGGLFVMLSVSASFAGDSAVLVNTGFSADGNHYIFGQYGRVDRTFQGWAEIYTVDVNENDYVDGGVFMTKPSRATAAKKGREVYDELASRGSHFTEKYRASPSGADQILYIREEEKKSATDEILFKDFTSSIGAESAVYSVVLVPTYSGSGVNARSSFFINLEKKDGNGNVVARQQVGTPSIKRAGVTGYKIERIECDRTGRNLVFIIEKTVHDRTGVNIRYMVEACSLNADFSVPAAKREKSAAERGISGGSVKPVVETLRPSEVVTVDINQSSFDYGDEK